MKWMEVAWAHEGVTEVAGPGAHSDILAFFRDAGHPTIVTDELAWCAAYLGACLERAGIKSSRSLMARSYQKFGTALEVPRVGCIAVLSRGGDPELGHVGFLVGETADHILLLGGNQSNSVSVAKYPKWRVVAYRWPEAEKTATELAAAGSRTVTTAKRARNDSLKATVAVGASAPATAPFLKDLSGLSRQAGELKSVLTGLVDFGAFLVGNVTAVAGTFALYWLLRIAWAQGWIA